MNPKKPKHVTLEGMGTSAIDVAKPRPAVPACSEKKSDSKPFEWHTASISAAVSLIVSVFVLFINDAFVNPRQLNRTIRAEIFKAGLSRIEAAYSLMSKVNANLSIQLKMHGNDFAGIHNDKPNAYFSDGKPLPGYLINSLEAFYADKDIPWEETYGSLEQCRLNFRDDTRLRNMGEGYMATIMEFRDRLSKAFTGTNNLTKERADLFMTEGYQTIGEAVRETEDFRDRYLVLWTESLRQLK